MVFWLLTACAFLATADDGATTHAPALVLRAILVTLIAIGARNHTDVAPPFALRMAMGLGALSALWGIVFSPNRFLGLQSAANAALVILCFWSLSTAPKKLGAWALQSTCLVATAQALWAIAQRIGGVERAHGGFFNPNDLAALLAPCTIIALSQRRKTPDSMRCRISIGAAVIMTVGLWSSGSRGGLGALFVGLIVMYMPRPKDRRVAAWGLLGVGVLAASCYFLLRERWDNHLDPYAYSRIDIWLASVRVFLNHPFGVGLGGYADALRVQGVPLPGWVRYPRVANHAHNEWLQGLVECGTLGGIAALVAPLSLAHTLRRGGGGRRDDWAALLTFVVPALTSATLHLPVVAFLAAIWAAHATHGLTVVRAHQPRLGRSLTLGAVFAVVLTLPGTLSHLTMAYAVTARDHGRLAEAIDWAEISQALNPDSVGAAMLAASLHFQKKHDVQATAERLAALTDIFAQSPDPPLRAAQLLASVSERPAQWVVTGRLYAVAAERDPHNALRWYEAGVAYERAGDEAAAEEGYTRALHEEPNCARALAAMAKRLEARGDAAAAARLRKAVQDSVDQSVHFSGHMAELLSLP